jgi:hypothetical protein
MKYRKVFYSEEKNKVRSKSFDWVSNSTLNEEDDFEYVGTMTPTELDLLVESLFSKYGVKDITLEQFENMFGDIRTFCDILKGLLEK